MVFGLSECTRITLSTVPCGVRHLQRRRKSGLASSSEIMEIHADISAYPAVTNLRQT